MYESKRRSSLTDERKRYKEGIILRAATPNRPIMVTISFKELLPNALRYHPEGNTVIYSILCGMGIMALSLILFAYAGI